MATTQTQSGNKKAPKPGDKAQEPEQPPAAATAPPEDEPPSGGGWDDVVTPDADGWFKVQEGAIITGRIIGRMKLRQDGATRDVLLVKVTRPTWAELPRSGGMQEFPAGSIIALGIRHRLKKLLFYVKHKGLIWVRADNQKKLRGRHTLWEFTVKAKGQMARPDPIDLDIDKVDDIDAEKSGDADFDDVPF